MIHVARFVFNDFQENTFVLYDETGECVIIDPGCNNAAEQKELSNYIETNNLQPKSLLNTHGHIDHVLGNRFIADEYKLKLGIHEKEIPVIESVKEYALSYEMHVDSPMPEIIFKDGDIVRFGNSSLEVLYTPGHSPGGISFYSAEDKFVIAGDVLFLQRIGRTDLPGGDMDTLMKSIKEKLFTLGDDVKVYTGHGPETTIGFERQNNPFLIAY